MIEELRIGSFVTWVEEPHLEGPITPSALVGRQYGEIIRLKKNTRLKATFVCVRNTQNNAFHWIEAEGACELLSPAASAA
jgi:hypothetical protein